MMKRRVKQCHITIKLPAIYEFAPYQEDVIVAEAIQVPFVVTDFPLMRYTVVGNTLEEALTNYILGRTGGQELKYIGKPTSYTT